MNKKTVSLVIIGALIISGIGAVAVPQTRSDTFQKVDVISLSKACVTENGEYVSIHVPEETSQLMDAGKPMLPVITKVYTFPLGTKILDVSVTYETETYVLDKKVQPAPRPLPLLDGISADIIPLVVPDEAVYLSSDLYPSEPYTVRMGAGLQNNEHVLFLTIDCHAQYSPATDNVFIPENIEINVEYQPPETPLFANDEYDLLIITDETFAADLQPLVDHKNSIGVKTILETVQQIYPQYNGRDEAEDIKLRIKDAIEEWGIKYVLLAGGRKGQTFDWYIPSRTTHNDDGWEGGYESDLYFADVYKIENDEVVFEDWDSNGNGVFAEWSNFVGKKDTMDYYPDVSVGRLPFRYASEVTPVVEKIIDYENNADDSWFKKGIVVSGDTFPPSRGGAKGWYEGEIETGKTVDYLEGIGFTMQKLWLSIPGAWTGPEDVVNAISGGAGFVHFAGHSNPASWGNHPPDDEEHEFVVGMKLRYMKDLTNTGKLPVIVLGGCHSCQFNVTMMNLVKDLLKYGLKGYFFGQPYRFYYMEWVPRDLCSWFVLEDGGGAIAAMGNTGLGYGYVNEHADEGLGGWIEPRFFDAYANQSITVLGSVHDQAIIDYINIIDSVNSDQIDRKTIEEWALIGDPSLQIGGI